MRKLLLAILAILLFASTAMAVDTITYTYQENRREGYWTHHWAVSTTDNPGTVDEAASGISIPIHGWILGYEVDPGASNQPDSSYNIELRDTKDFDYLYDKCSALDGTSRTASANISVPVNNSSAWVFVSGKQLSLYADGLGDCSGTCSFDLYLYVKPVKER